MAAKRTKQPKQARTLKARKPGADPAPSRPFDAAKHFGTITYDGDPVADQRMDRGRDALTKRTQRPRVTRPERKRQRGKAQRRTATRLPAPAKPFDPSKHLGVIRFKEDIDTVIRIMRDGTTGR